MSTARKARPRFATTSVKIPTRTKAMVVRAAKDSGKTVHGYLLDVIEEAAKRAALRREFVTSAEASLAGYKRTGLAHRAEDVHAWFEAKARGENPPPLKPVKIR
ncbi:MAG TPA: DUF1778 domain-containing protein [Myxococcales bacterium]|jgi:uncharacterized protein (DUF1778 family)|nr:DUF1778 domain-containing protein [Myxococcales bacterium]